MANKRTGVKRSDAGSQTSTTLRRRPHTQKLTLRALAKKKKRAFYLNTCKSKKMRVHVTHVRRRVLFHSRKMWGSETNTNSTHTHNNNKKKRCGATLFAIAVSKKKKTRYVCFSFLFKQLRIITMSIFYFSRRMRCVALDAHLSFVCRLPRTNVRACVCVCLHVCLCNWSIVGRLTR